MLKEPEGGTGSRGSAVDVGGIATGKGERVLFWPSCRGFLFPVLCLPAAACLCLTARVRVLPLQTSPPFPHFPRPLPCVRRPCCPRAGAHCYIITFAFSHSVGQHCPSSLSSDISCLCQLPHPNDPPRSFGATPTAEPDIRRVMVFGQEQQPPAGSACKRGISNAR